MGRILRRSLGAAGIAAAGLVLSGCSPYDKSDIKRLALPVPASDRTDPVWDLWLGSWIAVLVVFVLVFGLMVYAMIRFRKRDDTPPSQIRYHLPLEVLYTIAPCIIVAVFFFHTVVAQNAILKEVKNPDHEITVVGSKWQWAFDYIDEKAVEGEDVFDVGTPGRPGQPVPAGQRVGAVHPQVARRHPLVLDSGVLLQARRRSGQEAVQPVRRDADARRARSPAAAPSCAACTTRA